MGDADLSLKLDYCQTSMDIEYVAAASLLVRATVAKQTGLWMDFLYIMMMSNGACVLPGQDIA